MGKVLEKAVTVRLKPEIHRKLKVMAVELGTKMQTLISETVSAVANTTMSPEQKVEEIVVRKFLNIWRRASPGMKVAVKSFLGNLELLLKLVKKL